MTNIDDLLSPIYKALREKKLRSKQAIFNLYLPLILEAKQIYSWAQIAEHINTNTDSELATSAYINMTDRAKKKKISVQKQVTNIPQIAKTNSNKTKNPLSSLSERTIRKDEYNPTPDRSRIYGDGNNE